MASTCVRESAALTWRRSPIGLLTLTLSGPSLPYLPPFLGRSSLALLAPASSFCTSQLSPSFLVVSLSLQPDMHVHTRARTHARTYTIGGRRLTGSILTYGALFYVDRYRWKLTNVYKLVDLLTMLVLLFLPLLGSVNISRTRHFILFQLFLILNLYFLFPLLYTAMLRLNLHIY
jgi:hypothetical protein